MSKLTVPLTLKFFPMKSVHLMVMATQHMKESQLSISARSFVAMIQVVALSFMLLRVPLTP